MSLTTELNNPSSPISQWFAAKYHQSIGNIIERHNQVMSRSSILLPIDGTDFPLVGNAIAYSLRKFVATKQGNTQWVESTLAGTMVKEARLKQLATLCATQSKSSREEALKMLILGALESYYRISKPHEIIQPFIDNDTNHKKLALSLEYIEQWLPSILDVAQINAQLPNIWNAIEDVVDINSRTISNATFNLSRVIRADCQMIIGSSIIDIRTSAKRQPFTLNNLYQQLGYLLFDTNDEYQISNLVWVYSRQKVAFSYGVNELFKDINATREDFAQMIIKNYQSNQISTHKQLVQQSARYSLRHYTEWDM